MLIKKLFPNTMLRVWIRVKTQKIGDSGGSGETFFSGNESGLKERFCIYVFCRGTCPRTFLNCFVLNTLSYKAKKYRNVLGRKN